MSKRERKRENKHSHTPRCEYEYVRNVEFHGRIVGSFYTYHSGQCKDRCVDNDRCRFFTYYRNDWTGRSSYLRKINRCLLFNSGARAQFLVGNVAKASAPGVTSGFSGSCSEKEGCVKALQPNVEFRGKCVSSVARAASAEKCQRICTRSRQCRSFAYYTSDWKGPTTNQKRPNACVQMNGGYIVAPGNTPTRKIKTPGVTSGYVFNCPLKQSKTTHTQRRHDNHDKTTQTRQKLTA
ncbi:hypothetical protein WMY93_031393 [Mugilogobius chulae]|uniref:Apple domain-containing protein n=1 Tax=Mugilogobius chulae TaxID=88201 RepID=A0AAW0MET4_9GOBI